MATEYYFDTYLDSKKEWRWRFKAPNGKTMADSGEGYGSLKDCKDAIETIKKQVPGADVK
jgi:uncharacterized protein YegP (UPF0339 family)